jgi:hypothetical protein
MMSGDRRTRKLRAPGARPAATWRGARARNGTRGDRVVTPLRNTGDRPSGAARDRTGRRDGGASIDPSRPAVTRTKSRRATRCKLSRNCTLAKRKMPVPPRASCDPFLGVSTRAHEVAGARPNELVILTALGTVYEILSAPAPGVVSRAAAGRQSRRTHCRAPAAETASRSELSGRDLLRAAPRSPRPDGAGSNRAGSLAASRSGPGASTAVQCSPDGLMYGAAAGGALLPRLTSGIRGT